MSTVRLATRRSPLALAQAHAVSSRLQELGVTSELVEIETTGDRRLDVELSSMGGQGVFAVEIQRAVLAGQADVAVHSAKDLPSNSPEGLVLAAVPERRDAADVLVGHSLAGLAPGATVATGSPRRRALLLERRPDLNVVSLRGNMATRLNAVTTPGVDAVIAAAAALDRLGLNEQIAERLDVSWFVPQVGQGALALEARVGDSDLLELLARLNDLDAYRAVLAERAFLRELGAGCTLPVAAHATVHGEVLELSGVMARHDGSSVLRRVETGREPDELGSRLARILRDDLGGGSLVSAE